MTPDTLRFVVCTYLNDDPRRVTQLFGCVYSLLAQTYPHLEIYIHHDGPLHDTTLPARVESLDPRITFIVLPVQKKAWGFYDRRDIALRTPHATWVVFTNEDNYYLPTFTETMITAARQHSSEFVFCNMLHDHWGYTPRESYLRVGHIDMGNFMTSTRLVAATPWTHFTEEADGIYAEALSQHTTPVKVGQYLFVHN